MPAPRTSGGWVSFRRGRSNHTTHAEVDALEDKPALKAKARSMPFVPGGGEALEDFFFRRRSSRSRSPLKLRKNGSGCSAMSGSTIRTVSSLRDSPACPLVSPLIKAVGGLIVFAAYIPTTCFLSDLFDMPCCCPHRTSSTRRPTPTKRKSFWPFDDPFISYKRTLPRETTRTCLPSLCNAMRHGVVHHGVVRHDVVHHGVVHHGVVRHEVSWNK